MATAEQLARRKQRINNSAKYLIGTSTHPIKTFRERGQVGLPRLGSKGRDQFFTRGKAAVLDIPAEIEKKGKEADENSKPSLVTSLSSFLLMAGVLKNDPALIGQAYDLMEADLVYTPMTPKAKAVDYGVKVPPRFRASNQAALSVQTVLSMRDIFDYDDPNSFVNSLNGYSLLCLLINDMDALVDRGIVGQAQMRETFNVFTRRVATATGVPAVMIAPFIVADLLNSDPAQAGEWLKNIPAHLLKPALDALVGAAVGYDIGAKKDRQEIDPTLKNRVVGTIMGALGAGAVGGVTEAVSGTAGTALTAGGAVYLAAEKAYLEPKRKIKQSFENGIGFIKRNETQIIPFASSIFHQQGRRRIEINNAKRGEKIVKAREKYVFEATLGSLQEMGFTISELSKLTNAQIADDGDLDTSDIQPISKIVSSSYAATLFRANLLESLRMINHNRMHPESYKLMPILQPGDMADYVYTHGAAMRDAIDLTNKGGKPFLALSILFPSLWVYNLIDFVHPTTEPQKNGGSMKDAVNFAGRYENSGGTGMKMMTAIAFWREIWPQLVSANQFHDYYSVVADNLNNKNADGMRSNFSLVVQPNPMQEMLNAFSVFYIDFSLPDYHGGQTQRGAIKHIESMITNLVNQVDNNPRALMDLLTFVSYTKSLVMSKPYFEKLGYNVEIDNGKFFLDTAIKHIEEVQRKTIKILFDKYLANPRGLVLGFRDELASGKMTPQKADAIYRELTTLFEWTLREVPEFYSTRQGREVIQKMSSDLYERAGVYSAGNVFSPAFVDIFYNVIKVMGEHRKKESWADEDPRNQAFMEFSKVADNTLFVMLRNTLKVNVNPEHESDISNDKIVEYLARNFEFFEFGLAFATDASVGNIAVALKEILDVLDQQAVEFAGSELNHDRWTPERRKVHLMLTKVTTRVIKELMSRSLLAEVDLIARTAKSASERIAGEEQKKARAANRVI